MIIKSVEFAGAVARGNGAAPGDLVQVAFSGRSNVGKSSLINRLLGRTRKPIAKVSATPGKTQQINFFRVRVGEERKEAGAGARAGAGAGASAGSEGKAGARAGAGSSAGAGFEGKVDREFFLVDLPGYGYAKVPIEVRGKWKPLIEGFLRGSDQLVGVVQLIDARQGATPDDLKMVEFLAAEAIPTLFVVTKVDKLRSSERAQQLARITEALGATPDQVVAFSAKTGEGREELLESVAELVFDQQG